MAENETGLTRRGLLKKGAIIGAAAWATPVVQVIGMRPALAQTVSPPDDVCVPDNWAAAVIFSDQGTQQNGGAIPANRSDPTDALGPPTNTDFFSLGFNIGQPAGGVLVVQLGAPALQSTGAQLVVVETTNGPYPAELANVEVSPDGVTWTAAGTARNFVFPGTVLVGTNQYWTTLALPIPVVEYVRITDATNIGLFGSIPDADAFDVNAVGTNCPNNNI